MAPFTAERGRLDSIPGVAQRPADAATRTDSALAAQYRRLMHCGHKQAVVAVAHSMLVIAYHLLSRQPASREFGADYFDRRHAERATRRAVRQLERLGYRVTLQPAA